MTNQDQAFVNLFMGFEPFTNMLNLNLDKNCTMIIIILIILIIFKEEFMDFLK